MKAIIKCSCYALLGVLLNFAVSCKKVDNLSIFQFSKANSHVDYEKSVVNSMIQDTFFVQYYDLLNHLLFVPMDSTVENHGLSQWSNLINNFYICVDTASNIENCLGFVSNLENQGALLVFIDEGKLILDSLKNHFPLLEDSVFFDSFRVSVLNYIYDTADLFSSESNPSNTEAVPCYREYANRVLEARAELITDLAIAIFNNDLHAVTQELNDYYHDLDRAYTFYCNCMMENYGQSPC